ncbi:SirB2 family protein [Rodentibacter mrazii]|uniref:SirB2 family protein n=1 Tax=Rodentibacter mrazii TaxID=1908257 RepID=UPI0009846B0B|nr:SirB2 family protein [Rodentibacter mrazii]
MLIFLHVFCVFLSLGLLIVRGIMQLSGKDWRAIKLLKILPHLADTLLIVSGAVIFFLLPFELETWLIAKFCLLILYVIFSTKFFGRKVVKANPIFLLLSLMSFIGAILIAYFH